jgi:hypothetical protein
MSYLVVDDTDGRIVAEVASLERAVRVLGRCLDGEPQGHPPVSLVRLNDRQGSLGGVTSLMAMRPLTAREVPPARRPRRVGRRQARSDF